MRITLCTQHKMFSFRFDQPVLVLPDGLEYNEYNDIFRIGGIIWEAI